MKKEDLKFGDIITNGINYWFVCEAIENNKEPCICCQREYQKGRVIVIPVIVKNEKPLYLTEKFNEIDPDTIKPYWRRI